MKDIPPFEQGVAKYRDFLVSMGLPGEIQWVFREDVVVKYWARTWIHVPLPESNLSCAKDLYESGRQQGIGVLLDLFCTLDNSACCYVWIPKDEDDADTMLLSGLKFTVPNSSRQARPLRKGRLAAIRQMLGGRTQDDPTVYLLPTRSPCKSGAWPEM